MRLRRTTCRPSPAPGRCLRRRLLLAPVLGAALALAGCASDDAGAGGSALAGSDTCKSLKVELDRSVARGVIGKVEAEAGGRRLSPADKAEVDRYNGLLARYLGAQCHN
jgi:hypothetical protein